MSLENVLSDMERHLQRWGDKPPGDAEVLRQAVDWQREMQRYDVPKSVKAWMAHATDAGDGGLGIAAVKSERKAAPGTIEFLQMTRTLADLADRVQRLKPLDKRNIKKVYYMIERVEDAPILDIPQNRESAAAVAYARTMLATALLYLDKKLGASAVIPMLNNAATNLRQANGRLNTYPLSKAYPIAQAAKALRRALHPRRDNQPLAYERNTLRGQPGFAGIRD